MQYDEYYRPIILNPYHERVRIVYIYDNAPRIVWIPPLARAVLEVAQFAAYSFTAVVDTAANIVNAAVDTAVNVAVGTFFGGGYVPAIGLPLPPPPPPVLRYDNVPVQVRYSQATYEPFRVRRIIDVGDDVALRRAQGVARRCDSRMGCVDADAKRRTAIRGAQDPAVPGPGRSAGSSAAG